jgi:hypothetical protein
MECEREQSLLYYHRHRSQKSLKKHAASEKMRRLEHPEFAMYHAAKTRAKRDRIPFTIDKQDISIPETCPVLGIPLFVSTGSRQSDNSPTLDRINNAQGYVKGNVLVISWRANNIKSNATVPELTKVLDYMKRYIY